MLILLYGKSGTGKTSVAKVLSETYERIVTYTTRPMRPYEREGEPYHFVNEETFRDMVKGDEFVEYSNFVTGRYGTLYDDIDVRKNQVLVVEPNGLQRICRMLPSEDCVIFYMYCSDKTAKVRQIARGDDILEIALRSERDTVTFQEMVIDEFTDYFINTEYDSPEAIAKKIIEVVEKKCNGLDESNRFAPKVKDNNDEIEVIPFINSDTIEFNVNDMIKTNAEIVKELSKSICETKYNGGAE